MLEASLSKKQWTLPLFLSKFFHESKTIIQLSIAFLSVRKSDFVKKKLFKCMKKTLFEAKLTTPIISLMLHIHKPNIELSNDPLSLISSQ